MEVIGKKKKRNSMGDNVKKGEKRKRCSPERTLYAGDFGQARLLELRVGKTRTNSFSKRERLTAVRKTRRLQSLPNLVLNTQYDEGRGRKTLETQN